MILRTIDRYVFTSQGINKWIKSMFVFAAKV